MRFNIRQFAKITGPERATRKNEIWRVEIATLDIAHRPILLIAFDVFSRLPIALAPTSRKAGDIALELDLAGRRSGYPERLWVDQRFEFHSRQLQKWADLRGIELVFGAPFWKRTVAEGFLRQLSRFVRDNGLTNPGELKRKLAEWRQAYEEAAVAAIN
jgi:transposase InsO family protein